MREDIRVEDLAGSCGYSLYHFIRLFNEAVHHTPYDYLIRRRLTEAALELLHGHRRLVDIACDYRFQNPETFTRAFFRVFHTQPSQVRKNGVLDARLMLPERSPAHLAYYRSYGIPAARKIAFPQRYLAGYAFATGINAENVNEIFAGLKARFPGCKTWFWGGTYSMDYRNNQTTYFAGFEVADGSRLPSDLFARRLPSGSWAVFQQPNLLKNIELVREHVYQSWQANTGEKICSPLEVCQLTHHKDHDQSLLSVPLFNTDEDIL